MPCPSQNDLCDSFLLWFAYLLPLKQAAEKFQRVHAMGGIMRARIDATRLRVVQAEVARSSFHFHAGNPSSRIRGIVQLDRKRMHIDISVRTIVGALSAADTPVLTRTLCRPFKEHSVIPRVARECLRQLSCFLPIAK